MKNQNESLDESDFEYMQAERDVWKARYEFACADRKKLLSDNAGLVKNQESNTAAFLAMREERDALLAAIKREEAQSVKQVSIGDLQDKCCAALKRYKKEPTDKRASLIDELRDMATDDDYRELNAKLIRASDMLAADVQEIARLEAQVGDWTRAYQAAYREATAATVKCFKLEAQQVAVPQPPQGVKP